MKVTYRSKEQSIGIGLTALTLTLLICVSSLAAPRLSGVERVLGFAFGLLVGSFITLRMALAGVHATEDGIRIINPFGTRRVAWSSIERFSIGRWGLFPKIALVHLLDGPVLHVFGIEGPNPLTRPNNQSAERLVAELNQQLERRRGPSASS